jgi:hypothetical protein
MLCALPWLVAPWLAATPERVSMAGVEAGHCLMKLLGAEAACPGCGLTRSVALAVQGDLVTAMQMHFAGPPILLLSLAGVVVHGDVLRRGGPLPFHQRWLRRGHWVLVASLGLGWLMKLMS